MVPANRPAIIRLARHSAIAAMSEFTNVLRRPVESAVESGRRATAAIGQQRPLNISQLATQEFECMRRDELLELLCTLFPPFLSYWLANDNYFRDGGDFTAHGICASFSHYYLEFLANSDGEAISRLFASVESVIAADIEDADPTANAMATCFLENLSGTVAGERAKNFMGESSRRYFDS